MGPLKVIVVVVADVGAAAAREPWLPALNATLFLLVAGLMGEGDCIERASFPSPAPLPSWPWPGLLAWPWRRPRRPSSASSRGRQFWPRSATAALSTARAGTQRSRRRRQSARSSSWPLTVQFPAL